ncbi:hypothetical protein EXIGLDRAFT_718420 [Exidia glandulosa HHB12029]|uniref:Uncharacterized protein n=1 Tax=Exidia glandulosa HHB12029 TaxID=1314781 RepID=A0A165HQT0_EXIGL|nr:hypothetical protein EXIGLDRAFT_718420 [Exidia glandulosa HHB12029]
MVASKPRKSSGSSSKRLSLGLAIPTLMSRGTQRYDSVLGEFIRDEPSDVDRNGVAVDGGREHWMIEHIAAAICEEDPNGKTHWYIAIRWVGCDELFWQPWHNVWNGEGTDSALHYFFANVHPNCCINGDKYPVGRTIYGSEEYILDAIQSCAAQVCSNDVSQMQAWLLQNPRYTLMAPPHGPKSTSAPPQDIFDDLPARAKFRRAPVPVFEDNVLSIDRVNDQHEELFSEGVVPDAIRCAEDLDAEMYEDGERAATPPPARKKKTGKGTSRKKTR